MMTQLVVQLIDQEKAEMLSEFLSELPFVNSVKITQDSQFKDATDDDFFSLAGLWERRSINQESIRKIAWPEQ